MTALEMAEPLSVGVIVGTTRPGRKADAVARWVVDLAEERADVVPVLVDLADYGLPLLDETYPARHGRYEHEHTRRWSATVAPLDAFVFVTAEYNHSIPAVLKNAIDFLFDEWVDKAAGIVTYGVDANGTRAAEQLRLVLAEIHVADVRNQVALSLFDDFGDYTTFTPRSLKVADVHSMLDQLAAWGGALRVLRRAPSVV